MKMSDDRINEFKAIAEKDGKKITYEQASEGAHNLANLVELLWEFAQKDAAKKKRLRKEPDGFPVDSTYSCLVCHQTINESNGWYDWYGQTCLLCRKAIKERVIPAFICLHRESFFSMSALNYTFKIKHHTAKKYIKERKLIPRIILDENDKPHEYIFLKKENLGLVERYSPERKSWQRNRDKVSKQRSREWKKEMLEEFAKNKKKRV